MDLFKSKSKKLSKKVPPYIIPRFLEIILFENKLILYLWGGYKGKAKLAYLLGRGKSVGLKKCLRKKQHLEYSQLTKEKLNWLTCLVEGKVMDSKNAYEKSSISNIVNLQRKI